MTEEQKEVGEISQTAKNREQPQNIDVEKEKEEQNKKELKESEKSGDTTENDITKKLSMLSAVQESESSQLGLNANDENTKKDAETREAPEFKTEHSTAEKVTATRILEGDDAVKETISQEGATETGREFDREKKEEQSNANETAAIEERSDEVQNFEVTSTENDLPNKESTIVAESQNSEKMQISTEKDLDSEEVFHEAPEVNEEEVKLDVIQKQLEVDEGQDEDDWVNDGDPAENWVDADEERDQNVGAEVGEEGEEEQNEIDTVENGEEELDDDEIADNPAYIPKSPRYYMHDSRTVDKNVSNGRNEDRVSRADGKWKHDKFDERSQAPKSKRELVVRYGFDIRNQDKPEEAEIARSTKTNKHDKSKEEVILKGDNVRNTGKGGGGSRGTRGGPGRPPQYHNERPSRDSHAGRNSISQQQNRPPVYAANRGRGVLNKGPLTNRSVRQTHLQNENERSGEGRFRIQRDQRDHPIQAKRSNDHVGSRRGRGSFLGGARGDNIVAPNAARSNISGTGTSSGSGGGGKRYSKQRTAVAYGDQQRPLGLTTVPTTVGEVVPQISVPTAQPPPPCTPVECQRPALQPPTFQAQIRPLPPMQPQLQPPIASIAATVTQVTPTAYRAPNDTVYFDPSQQLARSGFPPQPRAKKRLVIVDPTANR